MPPIDIIISTPGGGSAVELNPSPSNPPFLDTVLNQKEGQRDDGVSLPGEEGEEGIEGIEGGIEEEGGVGGNGEAKNVIVSGAESGSSSSPPLISSATYKKHKGGRPRDSLADAIIEPEYPDTDDERKAKRTKCSHCGDWSQTTRSAPRARTHAAFECPSMPEELREQSLEKIINGSPAGSLLKDRASRRLHELSERRRQESREALSVEFGGEMDRHVLMKLGDIMIKYFPPGKKAGPIWIDRIQSHLESMKASSKVAW